jgi:hypothetical protein
MRGIRYLQLRAIKPLETETMTDLTNNLTAQEYEVSLPVEYYRGIPRHVGFFVRAQSLGEATEAAAKYLSSPLPEGTVITPRPSEVA